MSPGEISHVLVWGATSAYAVALICFAVDLAQLADRPDSRPAGTPAAARPSGRPTSQAPRRAAAIAMSVTTVGALLHLAGTITRGVAAGRVPWSNMYEFALVGTGVAVLTFLVLCRRQDARFLGTIIMGLTVIALGVALVNFYVPVDGLVPALQSPWLVIHVSIATIATGLFTVAFAASALQLLKDYRARDIARTSAPQPALVSTGPGRPDGRSPLAQERGMAHRRWRVLDQLPSTRNLEGLAFRINAVGFVLWTFTVMAGAVWAEHAWGRYWGWDPKEVWSFIVWVVYAAYLHARTTRGWSGRRAAWFVVAGYATVIFNFTGVNLFFLGLHSYSGL
ncbi:c-type cytochrome biogenesis protein CcsB [Actinotalea sp. K2]|uniref:c-type cytochrome biogenesis protein CcsB n=1 Tax=Actinotalea sp. K2 TaxID=2939438 RepID=UPI002016E20D|nr:c-type cytochrome biogenesis protein CcsB [Actinotalea sp. K2]MCL3862997.1 c-type cytochrome biogenesis protein CcsB [Actinotalea sp. K2]